MKFIVITLLLLTKSAMALDCSLAKLTSQDPKTGKISIGNGAAIDANVIVTNDHVISPDADSVKVWVDNRELSGRVLSRDFHTDLALVYVNTRLKKCNFNFNQIRNLDSLLLTGFDANDNSTSQLSTKVKNVKSSRLEVPGVETAIEVVGENQPLQVRQGLSGSVLSQDGKVIGIISQKTKEGTGLVIPSDVINEITDLMKSGKLPNRNYTYDYREDKAIFKGMKIPRMQNGTPHGGKGGTPHGGKSGNSPIALEDYDLGYAVAEVYSLKLLRLHDKNLADLLEKTKVQRIFISSIDNIKVTGFWSLLKALGNCSSCQITSYWLESADPNLLGGKAEQLQAFVVQMILALEKQHGQGFVKNLLLLIDQLNTKLVVWSHEEKAGLQNKQTQNEINVIWEAIELGLARKPGHNDEIFDLLKEIRDRLPVI